MDTSKSPHPSMDGGSVNAVLGHFLHVPFLTIWSATHATHTGRERERARWRERERENLCQRSSLKTRCVDLVSRDKVTFVMKMLNPAPGFSISSFPFVYHSPSDPLFLLYSHSPSLNPPLTLHLSLTPFPRLTLPLSLPPPPLSLYLSL